MSPCILIVVNIQKLTSKYFDITKTNGQRDTKSKNNRCRNVLNNDVETAEASFRVVRPCRIALFRFPPSSKERNSHALLRSDIHIKSARTFSNILETTVPRDTYRVTIAPSLEETMRGVTVVAVKVESIQAIGFPKARLRVVAPREQS